MCIHYYTDMISHDSLIYFIDCDKIAQVSKQVSDKLWNDNYSDDILLDFVKHGKHLSRVRQWLEDDRLINMRKLIILSSRNQLCYESVNLILDNLPHDLIDENKISLLCSCCEFDDVELLKKFMMRANLSDLRSIKQDPFVTACRKNNINVARFLFKNGSRLNVHSFLHHMFTIFISDYCNTDTAKFIMCEVAGSDDVRRRCAMNYINRICPIRRDMARTLVWCIVSISDDEIKWLHDRIDTVLLSLNHN